MIRQNVRQPDRVLAESIAGHKAERRTRAGEEWRAATKHDRVEVEPILVDKTKLGQASRQVWSANVDLSTEPSLQPAYHRLDIIPDKRGVGSDRLQRARHDPFGWLATPPRSRVPPRPNPHRLRPITQDLVHAAAVHAAGQLAHVLYEVTKQHGTRRKFLVIDIAVRDWFNPKTSFAMPQISSVQPEPAAASSAPNPSGRLRPGPGVPDRLGAASASASRCDQSLVAALDSSLQSSPCFCQFIRM